MLKVQNLFYSTCNKTLLRNISLSFQPGLIHGILGPNGSGKSSLLRTLTGIWIPTSGGVYWNGDDLLEKPRYQISKIITLVPQNPQVAFDFTVEEFVRMGRYSHADFYSNEIVEHSLLAADALQFQYRSITQLSQGERQRVYIARSLATEAPVMLFDEPMANLDLRHQIDLWTLFKNLAARGKTILIANHDLSNTEYHCDRIYIMQAGQCPYAGVFKEIVTPEVLEQVFGLSPKYLEKWNSHYDAGLLTPRKACASNPGSFAV